MGDIDIVVAMAIGSNIAANERATSTRQQWCDLLLGDAMDASSNYFSHSHFTFLPATGVVARDVSRCVWLAWVQSGAVVGAYKLRRSIKRAHWIGWEIN
ncbi:Os08g0136600 [Oryza sativa Japonica Group]|uniref:Os08g0136600 protein n=2 Tax=Oryza sativa subsp. japonica TaxID=39947 RepID=Q0J851_ORYSJ|nr:hypothetical protein EE612_042008 [Oryza sativa]BAD03068.1 unknown protein [Oryza sativa Japonica Group]BAD16316.1 unknown protein [Oryza sativa Japonica Group]BAF22864.1 Os08g0136600 [Oryza sativa Japonica Group]BAT03745.1 Os08g0136600 [Oryza sativa Japonica Group]|eukprot:NP_001060950.1 Os08g0136600 [Oryza sativa Japonica Group]